MQLRAVPSHYASEATLSEVKIAFVYFKAKLLGGLGNLTAKFRNF